MRIDKREGRQFFELTPTESRRLESELKSVVFMEPEEAIDLYGKYLSVDNDGLYIQVYENQLLAVMVLDRHIIGIKGPRTICKAVTDKSLALHVGKGAVKRLSRVTDIFDRLSYHQCI